MLRSKAKQIGLPPGTLIHVGEQKVENPELTIIDYDETRFTRRDDVTIADCLPFRESDGVSWINLYGLHDLTLIEQLGQGFSIDSLALEDIVDTEHRPKFEEYEDYTLLILKMLSFDELEGRVTSEQISLILGKGFVLSFQERHGDIFTSVRDRLKRKSGRIRSRGPDYLVYALIDSVVDSYFHILERIGDRLILLEQDLIDNPTRNCLNRIYKFKTELLLVRKSVWPLREVLGEMRREDSAHIEATTGIFLRDLYDHTIQVVDTVEIFRDTVSGLLDLYMSSVSNRMNEVMKVLTIMASIFIPLTFIAGIYGMNFEVMPELKWKWGYAGVWILMLSCFVGMVAYFKRKRWF